MADLEKKFLSHSRIWAVRADTSIAACVRIMRDQTIGALVVLSDNAREDVVGIFTERDLVKHIEVVQHSKFWDHPIRTVMTANVRTLMVSKISEAPEMMIRHGFRHIPIVSDEKTRKRLIGVLSMRDIFRVTMEAVDFDLNKFFAPKKVIEKAKAKMIGVFSSDPAMAQLVNKSKGLSNHLVLKAAPLPKDLDLMAEHLKDFDALLIDIDGVPLADWEKLMERRKKLAPNLLALVVFNPLLLPDRLKRPLQKIMESKRVFVLSKPIPIGLLYEKFLKEI